jgi:hypothetical protein
VAEGAENKFEDINDEEKRATKNSATMTRNMMAKIKNKMVTQTKQEMTTTETTTKQEMKTTTSTPEDGDEGDQGDEDDELQQEEGGGFDEEENGDVEGAENKADGEDDNDKEEVLKSALRV